MRTRYVFIEDQQVPKGGRDILEIFVLFEQGIRFCYPHIDVYRVNPRSLRAYFGISVKQGKKKMTEKQKYDKGKELSRMFFRKICKNNHYDVERYFVKSGVFHVDPMEAGLLAIYGYIQLDKFTTRAAEFKAKYDQLPPTNPADCKVDLDLSMFFESEEESEDDG